VNRPFVVTIASEKGGVGKTTIATNLAVYIKALREDLPVTIASFDNHFSVDQMFALGPRPKNSVADLLSGDIAGELAVLGQYGVQYIASSRRMQAPSHSPGWLSQQLHAAALPGILILDTRPILDWFTEAALLAADLVLVPVKDRASLVNADALRQALTAVERCDRLWLLPSLVDSRARLNAEVRVHEFLVYAARERDYQVLDFCISKSPKVESLSSGFSSSIRPVLTHARNTAVHGQLKQLAEFALSRSEVMPSHGSGFRSGSMPSDLTEMSVGHRRRLVLECPLCCRQSLQDAGHFYFDLRSRRRGFIHPGCFEQISDDLNLGDAVDPDHLFALTIDGPGLVAPECRLTAHMFDSEGRLIDSEEVDLSGRQSLVDLLSMITGQSLDVAYREFILVDRVARNAAAQLADGAYRRFALRRRQIARELRDAGLF
jgi:cellulose biosynthesis protein BcsQ